MMSHRLFDIRDMNEVALVIKECGHFTLNFNAGEVRLQNIF